MAADLGAEAALVAAIRTALSRLRADLRLAVPGIAADLEAWQRSLAGSLEPADYFTHIKGFPLLRLPWWMYQAALAAGSRPDEAFLDDLLQSTICGYYVIRMIDNVMDGHAEGEQGLLPALGLFHSRFQAAYGRWFAPDHPFWRDFHGAWDRSCQVTIQDGQLTDVTWADFVATSGQKTIAARIPLAAIAHRYGQQDRFHLWADWASDFGLWHQLQNDFFDWNKDLRIGTATYVLSEARRQAGPNGDVADWMIHHGLAWASAKLLPMLDRLAEDAQRLGSDALCDYIATRRRLLKQDRQDLDKALKVFGMLSAAIKS
ncbi:MAG: class 1 isoprenoid biosynthesis enzyme [Rhodospirillaceae bacterium]